MHIYIFFFVYIIVSKRGGTFAFFVDVVVLKIKQTYNDSDLSIAFYLIFCCFLPALSSTKITGQLPLLNVCLN